MTGLSSNLKRLMSQAKINASVLSRQTGIAQPIIHRLITGQNTNPKLGTLKPLSEYFTVSVSQLIGETALPSEKRYNATSAEQQGWRRIPLIAWEDAIDWPAMQCSQRQVVDSLFVLTDAHVSHGAYSLKIEGSMMEPILPDKTRVIVEPSRVPCNNDLVLVHLKSETEARLKKMIIDGPDNYVQSLNPYLDKLSIFRLQSEDKILGVIAQVQVVY